MSQEAYSAPEEMQLLASRSDTGSYEWSMTTLVGATTEHDPAAAAPGMGRTRPTEATAAITTDFGRMVSLSARRPWRPRTARVCACSGTDPDTSVVGCGAWCGRC